MEKGKSLQEMVLGKSVVCKRMKPDHSTYKNEHKMDERLECNT